LCLLRCPIRGPSNNLKQLKRTNPPPQPPSAAAALGLPAGLPVAQGGADAFIGCIGLGVVAPGQMAMLTGSSHLHIGGLGLEGGDRGLRFWVGSLSPKLLLKETLFPPAPHAGMSAAPLQGKGMFGSYSNALLPGVQVVEGGQTSTGSAVNWLRRGMMGGAVGYAELNEEAAAVPAGCEGLVCLDHFQVGRRGGVGEMGLCVMSWWAGFAGQPPSKLVSHNNFKPPPPLSTTRATAPPTPTPCPAAPWWASPSSTRAATCSGG
jgi:hypothetical protein